MENSESKYSFDPSVLKALLERGPDFLSELFRMAMNEAMKLERERFLNAGAYERTEGRQEYANGFKPKNYNMRNGTVTLSIPRRGTATSIRRPCGKASAPSGPWSSPWPRCTCRVCPPAR